MKDKLRKPFNYLYFRSQASLSFCTSKEFKEKILFACNNSSWQMIDIKPTNFWTRYSSLYFP